MASYNFLNIGSGDGLLPGGTKPLTESMLTNHQYYCGVDRRAILQEVLKIYILDVSLTITDSSLQLHLP